MEDVLGRYKRINDTLDATVDNSRARFNTSVNMYMDNVNKWNEVKANIEENNSRARWFADHNLGPDGTSGSTSYVNLPDGTTYTLNGTPMRSVEPRNDAPDQPTQTSGQVGLENYGLTMEQPKAPIPSRGLRDRFRSDKGKNPYKARDKGPSILEPAENWEDKTSRKSFRKSLKDNYGNLKGSMKDGYNAARSLFEKAENWEDEKPKEPGRIRKAFSGLNKQLKSDDYFNPDKALREFKSNFEGKPSEPGPSARSIYEEKRLNAHVDTLEEKGIKKSERTRYFGRLGSLFGKNKHVRSRNTDMKAKEIIDSYMNRAEELRDKGTHVRRSSYIAGVKNTADMKSTTYGDDNIELVRKGKKVILESEPDILVGGIGESSFGGLKEAKYKKGSAGETYISDPLIEVGKIPLQSGPDISVDGIGESSFGGLKEAKYKKDDFNNKSDPTIQLGKGDAYFVSGPDIKAREVGNTSYSMDPMNVSNKSPYMLDEHGEMRAQIWELKEGTANLKEANEDLEKAGYAKEKKSSIDYRPEVNWG